MINLYDYQIEAVNALFAAWKEGARSVLLACPTGFGKTVLSLWLMQYAQSARRRVLFVGNRRLLVSQAQAKASQYGLDHGVIMADSESGNPGATNQIASIQTLESWYFYEKFSDIPTGRGLPPADLVVCDEAHGDIARNRTLVSFYPHAKILGLSATPAGPDGRSLVPDPYDILLEPVKNSRLVQIFREEGVRGLLPTTVFAPSEPHLEGVKVVKGQEYNQAQLGRRVQECTVFADVFGEWERSACGRATVCFVPGIPFGRDLVERLRARMGAVSAYLIEAATKHDERERIFEAMRDGSCKFVVSCDVLKEGWDLPVVSCGIDLRPDNQLRSYWQKVGRIKRPFPGQSNALWLDFAGNYWKFPHPDEDPVWPVGGSETTQDLVTKSRQEKGEPQPIMCPACSYVRARGPKCPNCGHEGHEIIRRIRMGKGELKEVPAVERKKVELSHEQKMLKKWERRLMAALYSGITYGQCAAIFHREHGEYPKRGWPGTYSSDSLDWKRRPKHEHTYRSLGGIFKRYMGGP